jgi:hypothetical protein
MCSASLLIEVNKKQSSPSTVVKYKIPLWYKYPMLYNGLSILVNKMHEQVLLHSKYNSVKY